QIRVEGYTDSSGAPEYNLKLSEQRAAAVVSFMSEQGINPRRSSSVGFGIKKPIADNSSAEGRKKNRRVEIVLTRK
ncbi:MAG: OmpA family protein, partial [Actinobacteria bacterium]